MFICLYTLVDELTLKMKLLVFLHRSCFSGNSGHKVFYKHPKLGFSGKMASKVSAKTLNSLFQASSGAGGGRSPGKPDISCDYMRV